VADPGLFLPLDATTKRAEILAEIEGTLQNGTCPLLCRFALGGDEGVHTGA